MTAIYSYSSRQVVCFPYRTLSVLNKCKDVPVDGTPLWVVACACIINAAKLRPEGTTVTSNTVFGAVQKVVYLLHMPLMPGPCHGMLVNFSLVADFASMLACMHALQVLGARATCTCSDLCSADLWLASAVNVSGSIRLVSDILQDTLAKLHCTGMPAFIDQELPDLCDTILEALHSKITFQGCLTRGVFCC